MSAAAAPERGWKSEKVDEAQALARSCAARRPDFQPCDGLSICATHSHGKCFKLHWCDMSPGMVSLSVYFSPSSRKLLFTTQGDY
ncbi:UPF0524 protein C3orf70 homolog [Peromyscus eremicus]|uniref:UPF0524 protein C3orf70 homolog n=1 Tax=Peromyscus eremicus TaxID=42410 RepID=UPI0027DB53AB|nr:UPF0524 protein C3orf70 homolog [Peromyscus eremicus]